MSTSTSEQLSMSSQDLDYFESPSKLFKCIEDHAWDVAIRRLERMPQEARLWIVRRAFDGSTVWRRLPIHEALIQSAPIKVIEGLLNAYPDSAKEVGDSTKRLAIHYACEHNASTDVIKLLLELCPDCVKVMDSSKRLAIHYACEHDASTDVIKLLLVAYPSCLNESDNGGNTPGRYLESLKDLIGKFSENEKNQSLSLVQENNEIQFNQDGTSIMVKVLDEELVEIQKKLAVVQTKEKTLSEENQQLLTQVNELLLTNRQLEIKLHDTVASSTDMEKRLLNDKEAALSQLKEEHQQEILLMQECRRQTLGDLSAEFNSYKEAQSILIVSLETENASLVGNLMSKESKLTELQHEVGKLDTELKRQVNLAEEANKRADDLSIKLKEAVVAIQKATNSILEERQSCAELEEEMGTVVRNLDLLQSHNEMLEQEISDKDAALNAAKHEIEMLSDQKESAQKELLEKTTELEKVKYLADDLSHQLNEAVEKCENAVIVITGQQNSIHNLSNDLKEKDENITRLEDELCDLKLNHHAAKEQSAALAKKMKLINLCLLSTGTVEERSDDTARFGSMEKLARHQVKDESWSNDKRSTGLSNMKKGVGSCLPLEAPTFDDSRYDYDGEQELGEPTKSPRYVRSSPKSSPHSRGVQKHDEALMSLSRMIQDLVSDRRGSVDVEQAPVGYTTFD